VLGCLRRRSGPARDRTAATTCDLIDRALHQFAERRGAWLGDDLTASTSPDEARLRFDPGSPVADGRWPYDT
jgi:hypothetical protein